MSKANRSTPDLASRPTVEIKTPRMPARRPLTGALPLKMPTMLTPQSVRMKNSGELNESTRGRRIGNDANSTSAPKIPPISDATNDALRARAPSPFLAMG
jgi:hypothetical protein